MLLAEFVKKLGGTTSGQQGAAPCPVPGHGQGRGDVHSSLSISIGRRGKILLHCHGGCPSWRVWAAIHTDLGENAFRVEQPTKTSVELNRARANAIWQSSSALDGTVADGYLRSRGLKTTCPWLRYSSACKYPLPPYATMPALIAAFTDQAGNVSAVQRVYLTLSSKKADLPKPKMSLGTIGGSAIRLSEPTEVLGLAEGLETALSAEKLFNVPVWASGGSAMHRVGIPNEIRRLIIFADHDVAGSTAAYRTAREFQRQGKSVEVRRPVQLGFDWNDVLVQAADAADA